MDNFSGGAIVTVYWGTVVTIGGLFVQTDVSSTAIPAIQGNLGVPLNNGDRVLVETIGTDDPKQATQLLIVAAPNTNPPNLTFRNFSVEQAGGTSTGVIPPPYTGAIFIVH